MAEEVKEADKTPAGPRKRIGFFVWCVSCGEWINAEATFVDTKEAVLGDGTRSVWHPSCYAETENRLKFKGAAGPGTAPHHVDVSGYNVYRREVEREKDRTKVKR